MYLLLYVMLLLVNLALLWLKCCNAATAITLLSLCAYLCFVWVCYCTYAMLLLVKVTTAVV